MDGRSWIPGFRDLPLELGAVAGPIVLTAAWLFLGAVSPGYTLWGVRVAPYSPVSQPISGLGLGSTGPYMNAAFVLSGLLMVAGAFGVCQRIPRMRGRRWSVALLALPGIGSAVDGLFTFQSFFLHFIGFGLALSTILTFPLVGRWLRGTPGWQRFGTALIAAGPLTLVLTVVYFATFTPTIAGIQTGVAGMTERALVLEIQAWYVVLGASTYLRSRAGFELAFD
ncbi:MAG TPA: DUF998 domain-containing protein [Candidatus Dormibacteraeota bacterium]|nr:DUF998 domain-containing protein [Candidatus Dormibacteraeota bacterium]